MTTITPDHLYFITVHYWQAKNRLQQAIQEEMRQYQHQLLRSSPESLFATINNTVQVLNTTYSRCKKESVSLNSYNNAYVKVGSYMVQLTLTPVMGEIALAYTCNMPNDTVTKYQ